MGQDFRGHANSNPFCSLNQQHRNFCWKGDWLTVPAIVRILIFCDLGIVEDVFGEREQSALDIPGR